MRDKAPRKRNVSFDLEVMLVGVIMIAAAFSLLYALADRLGLLWFATVRANLADPRHGSNAFAATG